MSAQSVDARLNVRRAVIGDAAGISHVHVEAWRSAYAGLLPAPLLANLDVERRLTYWTHELESSRSTNNAAWILEQDGRVVGFANFGPCRDADRQAPGDRELYAIYLLDSQWGRGHGRALATEAFAGLPDEATSVSLWVLAGNERAIRFYRSLGFEFDGTVRHEVLGGIEVVERRYVRVLPLRPPR